MDGVLKESVGLHFLYDKQSQAIDGVREVIIEAGTKLEFCSNANMIIAVIEGEIECTLDGYLSCNIQRSNLFFTRLEMNCSFEVVAEAKLVFLWTGYAPIHEDTSAQYYTDGVTRNDVQFNYLKEDDPILPALPFNNSLELYFQGIGLCLILQDQYFSSLKTREFFFLLGFSYGQLDRTRFFESLHTAEQSFSAFVYRNYKQVSSIQEFADLACYSLSGFEKRFRRIFGQSASAWIAKKKAQMIYNEICASSKPFKQLTHEYGFSYPTHFARFCKTHFGESPSMLRTKYKLINQD